MAMYALEEVHDGVGYLSCKKQPKLNVLKQEDFKERAELIFQALEDALVKTFGAYGAPTLISNYPYRHMTKDGFTVAKNIRFDHITGEPIDRAIALMATDICGRLNYSVGDGTTSAIIAVNRVYKELQKIDLDYGVRPKELMDAFRNVKDLIVKRLEEAATPVTEENMEEVIRKVVHVSSNSDEQITEFITQAYKEIGYPSIVCEKTDDIESKLEIINGFLANVRLGDQIYVNSDKKVASYKSADVIIFDHKINSEIYNDIILPIKHYDQIMERKLICIAPFYDDVLLAGQIRRDLMDDFKVRKDSTLVVCAYKNASKYDKKSIADLAMVLGTTLIDRDLEEAILQRITTSETRDIREIINIDDRGISGTRVMIDNTTPISNGEVVSQERKDKTIMSLGFVEKCELGMKTSIFKATNYDKELYDRCCAEAKQDLDEAIAKYAGLGTYAREVYDAQRRYASLQMKIATIYVGGESDLSKDMLKDSVDDAIRAAESAYRYGYVQGCNTTLLNVIDTLRSDRVVHRTVSLTNLEFSILKAIKSAFRGVYKCVLKNAFSDEFMKAYPMPNPPEKENYIKWIEKCGVHLNEETKKSPVIGFYKNEEDGLIDTIIEIGVRVENKCFDLESMSFSGDVINSVKTDIEILSATVDLLGLLIVGNQVVMTDATFTEKD